MLGFWQRIWGAAGKAPAVAALGAPGATTPAPVSARPGPAASVAASKDFVRRQALLDRTERIAGYAFSLVSGLQDRLKSRGDGARRAFDAALLTRLTLHGGASLPGQRLALVHLAADALQDPQLANLPAANTVLMLDLSQPGTDPQASAERAAALSAQGFFIGLQLHDASLLAHPLLACADFVQLDVARFDGLELRQLQPRLQALRNLRQQRPRLLACNLQSHDEFLFSMKCGFDFFQGPFVNNPDHWRTPGRGGINRAVVLPVLHMLRADASFATIAEQLKNEPTLSYKLLRYLQSPAMGLHGKVHSLTEALVLIGREKFYRWMSLLLFDFANPSYPERTLSERALTRGRTLELLAGQGHIPAAPDLLFLTGLFSLLDKALQLPMAALLDQAALPEPVSQALLGQAGGLLDALQLVTLCEADAPADPDQVAEALLRCGIDDALYAVTTGQALVWANAALGAVP
jgi:EAL and modified HD-GYP domain-containing signal transduction protein